MNNDSLTNRYEIIREIGKGGFGTVYLAISRRTGNYVAIKTINVNQQNRPYVIKEIKALIDVSLPNCSPYVSCYIDSFYDPSRNQAVIEMEYIDGPTILRYVSPLRSQGNTEMLILTGKMLLLAMLLGLQYVHSKGMLHNDVKPDNIIVSSNNIPVLVDFGLSCFLNNQGYCPEKGGTSIYIPPEAVTGERYPASDLWSLGATVYSVITGNNIWSLNTNQPPLNLARQVNNKIKNHVLPNQLNTGDVALDSVVNSFLSYNINDRMTIYEALKTLGYINN